MAETLRIIGVGSCLLPNPNFSPKASVFICPVSWGFGSKKGSLSVLVMAGSAKYVPSRW